MNDTIRRFSPLSFQKIFTIIISEDFRHYHFRRFSPLSFQKIFTIIISEDFLPLSFQKIFTIIISDSSKSDKPNTTTATTAANTNTNNRRDLILTQIQNIPHISKPLTSSIVTSPEAQRDVIPQGVILREQAVMTSHSGQKPAKIVLTSYVRRKRLYSLQDHKAGNKRILKRLQKTAKCIIRKIWKKKCTWYARWLHVICTLIARDFELC